MTEDVKPVLAGQESTPTATAQPVPIVQAELLPDAPAAPKGQKGMKGFQPGHPRWGGRKPGTGNKRTKAAQDMAREMGVDPVRFLLMIVQSDRIQVSEPDPDNKGKLRKVWREIPLDMRIDAAKSVAKFIHPTLQATQISGSIEGAVTTVDLTKLMLDPAMARAAQDLAMGMAQNNLKMLPPGDDD